MPLRSGDPEQAQVDSSDRQINVVMPFSVSSSIRAVIQTYVLQALVFWQTLARSYELCMQDTSKASVRRKVENVTNLSPPDYLLNGHRTNSRYVRVSRTETRSEASLGLYPRMADTLALVIAIASSRLRFSKAVSPVSSP